MIAMAGAGTVSVVCVCVVSEQPAAPRHSSSSLASTTALYTRASNEGYPKLPEDFYSFLNVKAILGAFNQEKAVWVFPVIVKSSGNLFR